MLKYKSKVGKMKMFFILTLLCGWLIAEIKDFFYNGGIANLLAFGLLKIIFILIFILALTGVLSLSHIIVKLFTDLVSACEWASAAQELMETPEAAQKSALDPKEPKKNIFRRNNSN